MKKPEKKQFDITGIDEFSSEGQMQVQWAGWNGCCDVWEVWLKTQAPDQLSEGEITSKKYSELLMSVESKYEGETRHQTALRYIREAEKGNEQGEGDK